MGSWEQPQKGVFHSLQHVILHPSTSHTLPLQYALPVFSNTGSTNHICTSLIPSAKSLYPPPCHAAIPNHGQPTFRLLQQERKHQAGGCFALGKAGSGIGRKHQDLRVRLSSFTAVWQSWSKDWCCWRQPSSHWNARYSYWCCWGLCREVK